MNKLVEEIIKPILEADSKITKVVGIYGGRFQPFGPHHKKVYEWLKSQFDDAYITTSNIKKLPRHPMNFKEKVRHMTKMGIPSSKIIMEKSPFVAKNLEKKFNADTTAFVYIFGKKDTGRLGGGKYFQDFKKNKNNLKGYKEHGYYLVAPHMSVSAGGLEVSGTAMRELLGSEKYKDDREKLFKKMFGYFNKGVYQMMTNKFSKIFEDVDMEFKPKSMHYVPSKIKPLKKKWKDGKGKELLQDLELPIKVGDVVRMGRFKNKKVTIKSIDWNEKGDLMINGRPALKFRIEKKAEVEEFLKTINIGKIIREATATKAQGKAMVDDGPSAFMGGKKGYGSRNKVWAEKLGFEVINYILRVDADDLPPNSDELLDSGWPMGPHSSVSYLPAGIGTGVTPNNQENLTGRKGYNKWLRNIRVVAQEVGMKMMKFNKDRNKINKNVLKQMTKDTKNTIKLQKKEEDNFPDVQQMGESVLKEDDYTGEWWTDMTASAQKAYLAKHKSKKSMQKTNC